MEKATHSAGPSRPGREQRVRIGSAFISLIEPETGYERDYNRWYADDHFYSGGMALPWKFAGRRWVATRPLRDLRYPERSNLPQPNTLGCYLHTYWVEDGQLGTMAEWLGRTLRQLSADDRMFVDGDNFHRTHIYSAFQPYVGAVYRDIDGAAPLDIHALDYPFAGLVLEIIDCDEGVDRRDLVDWLEARFIPERIAGSAAATCLIFLHAPMPEAAMSGLAKRPPGAQAAPTRETRVTLLWFLDVTPQDCWDHDFKGHDAAIAASKLGTLQLAAPFIPTLPGSDAYVEQLR